MPVKLFVGGLSFSTSTDRLRETFARFGGVNSAAVMTDRETGRSRGFGFVEMASPEEAEQAIGSLNGSSLDGRTIRVDKATPRGMGPTGGYRGGGPGAGPRPGFADRRPPAGGGFAPRSGFAERPGGFGNRPPGGPGGDDRGNRAPDRRGGFGERRGGPQRRGNQRGSGAGEVRRSGPGGQRPGQRRSNDRGRRSLGDEGGYRPY